MWSGKFLDLEEDLKKLAEEFKDNIFEDITKSKLTPLEFTIIEIIFNKEISGYDVINDLNKHFAGTWVAKSGTVYPILSKLKKAGFLAIKQARSPVGPIKKLYYLTKAGNEILKLKISVNFKDQISFIKNFLIKLSLVYIASFSEDVREEKVKEIQELYSKHLIDAIKKISNLGLLKSHCPKCKKKIENVNATFCSFCGADIYAKKTD